MSKFKISNKKIVNSNLVVSSKLLISFVNILELDQKFHNQNKLILTQEKTTSREYAELQRYPNVSQTSFKYEGKIFTIQYCVLFLEQMSGLLFSNENIDS